MASDNPGDAPHPVDIHVGNRIRMARVQQRLSQSELAARVGVSFQAIQKYETGEIRISASRLYEVAQALQAAAALELAQRQQKSGGGIVSFEVKGGQNAAWGIIDATRLLSITANLGDTKTTITHPATTTHGRLSPEAREVAGIRDGLLRVAVGLEALEDIQHDLSRFFVTV